MRIVTEMVLLFLFSMLKMSKTKGKKEKKKELTAALS